MAEQRRHQCAQGAQGQQLCQREWCEGGYALNCQSGGGDAQQTGHQLGQKGGEETGNDGGVVHDAYALHFHSKNSRADRRAEEGGKSGGHPGHGEDAGVPVIQLQQTAQLTTDAAADLEGGALPSGTAAGEVGEDGGQEDQRQHAKAQLPGVPY